MRSLPVPTTAATKRSVPIDRSSDGSLGISAGSGDCNCNIKIEYYLNGSNLLVATKQFGNNKGSTAATRQPLSTSGYKSKNRS